MITKAQIKAEKLISSSDIEESNRWTTEITFSYFPVVKKK